MSINREKLINEAIKLPNDVSDFLNRSIKYKRTIDGKDDIDMIEQKMNSAMPTTSISTNITSKKKIAQNNKQMDIDITNQDNINAQVKMGIISEEEKKILDYENKFKKGALTMKEKLLAPSINTRINYHVNILTKQMGLNPQQQKKWYWIMMREEVELSKKNRKFEYLCKIRKDREYFKKHSLPAIKEVDYEEETQSNTEKDFIPTDSLIERSLYQNKKLYIRYKRISEQSFQILTQMFSSDNQNFIENVLNGRMLSVSSVRLNRAMTVLSIFWSFLQNKYENSALNEQEEKDVSFLLEKAKKQIELKLSNQLGLKHPILIAFYKSQFLEEFSIIEEKKEDPNNANTIDEQIEELKNMTPEKKLEMREALPDDEKEIFDDYTSGEGIAFLKQMKMNKALFSQNVIDREAVKKSTSARSQKKAQKNLDKQMNIIKDAESSTKYTDNKEFDKKIKENKFTDFISKFQEKIPKKANDENKAKETANDKPKAKAKNADLKEKRKMNKRLKTDEFWNTLYKL